MLYSLNVSGRKEGGCECERMRKRPTLCLSWIQVPEQVGRGERQEGEGKEKRRTGRGGREKEEEEEGLWSV